MGRRTGSCRSREIKQIAGGRIVNVSRKWGSKTGKRRASGEPGEDDNGEIVEFNFLATTKEESIR